ncbi:MAG: hypothetical protein HY280_04760 [Nitrospinae bacterium]|nr:hypothetical protein [Nitrospinota bacterium]
MAKSSLTKFAASSALFLTFAVVASTAAEPEVVQPQKNIETTYADSKTDTFRPRPESPALRLDWDGRYTAPARLANPGVGEEGASLSIAAYGAKVSVPTPVSAYGGYATFGFRYSETDVWLGDYSGAQQNYLQPLHSFILDGRFVKPTDAESRYTVMLNLGYHSAAEDWGFDAVRLQGGVMYDTSYGEHSRIGGRPVLFRGFWNAIASSFAPLPIRGRKLQI